MAPGEDSEWLEQVEHERSQFCGLTVHLLVQPNDAFRNLPNLLPGRLVQDSHLVAQVIPHRDLAGLQLGDIGPERDLACVERRYVGSKTCEPVLNSLEPVLDTVESSFDTPEPVLDTVESSVDTPEPVLDTVESSVDTTKPVLDTVEPILNSSQLTIRHQKPPWRGGRV